MGETITSRDDDVFVPITRFDRFRKFLRTGGGTFDFDGFGVLPPGDDCSMAHAGERPILARLSGEEFPGPFGIDVGMVTPEYIVSAIPIAVRHTCVHIALKHDVKLEILHD